MLPLIVTELKNQHQESESVWFLVNLQYRIIHFNNKAASNSISFHNKKIEPGASILDYARDTKNQVDAKFINCFGRAATNKVVEMEQQIIYNSATIWTRSTYTPVFHNEVIYGISILVDDITKQKLGK
jgi:hypothetical protein